MHLRSYFLLSCLNSERLMNIGFAYSIMPGLKNIYKKREELLNSAIRHLEFFNTHPYLACIILGAVIKEEQRLKEGICREEHISTLKRSCMGPLGAIGDVFFWATIRPLCSLFGASIFFFHPSLSIPLFLFLYNLFHIPTRCIGLKKGYKLGRGIMFSLTKFPIQPLVQSFRSIMLLFCGIIFCRLLFINPYTTLDFLGKMSCVALLALTAYGIKRGIKKEVLLFSLLFFAFLFHFFG